MRIGFKIAALLISTQITAFGFASLSDALKCYLPTGGEISPTLSLNQIIFSRSQVDTARLADPYPIYLKRPSTAKGVAITAVQSIRGAREWKTRFVRSTSHPLSERFSARIIELSCEMEGEKTRFLPYTIQVDGFDSNGCCEAN